MTRPCARVLCSRAVSWAMPAHAVEPGRRAEPTCPPSLFVDRSYVPVWPALLPAISGALSTRPQRRRRRWPIQRSELLPSLTPCGLSNRARRHPFVAGLPPRRSPTLGSVHSATRDAGFRRAACAHTGASMGLWIRSPTLAPR